MDILVILFFYLLKKINVTLVDLAQISLF